MGHLSQDRRSVAGWLKSSFPSQSFSHAQLHLVQVVSKCSVLFFFLFILHLSLFLHGYLPHFILKFMVPPNDSMIALVDESETDDALRFSAENQRRCVVFLFAAFFPH